MCFTFCMRSFTISASRRSSRRRPWRAGHIRRRPSTFPRRSRARRSPRDVVEITGSTFSITKTARIDPFLRHVATLRQACDAPVRIPTPAAGRARSSRRPGAQRVRQVERESRALLFDATDRVADAVGDRLAHPLEALCIRSRGVLGSGLPSPIRGHLRDAELVARPAQQLFDVAQPLGVPQAKALRFVDDRPESPSRRNASCVASSAVSAPSVGAGRSIAVPHRPAAELARLLGDALEMEILRLPQRLLEQRSRMLQIPRVAPSEP